MNGSSSCLCCGVRHALGVLLSHHRKFQIWGGDYSLFYGGNCRCFPLSVLGCFFFCFFFFFRPKTPTPFSLSFFHFVSSADFLSLPSPSSLPPSPPLLCQAQQRWCLGLSHRQLQLCTICCSMCALLCRLPTHTRFPSLGSAANPHHRHQSKLAPSLLSKTTSQAALHTPRCQAKPKPPHLHSRATRHRLNPPTLTRCLIPPPAPRSSALMPRRLRSTALLRPTGSTRSRLLSRSRLAQRSSAQTRTWAMLS